MARKQDAERVRVDRRRRDPPLSAACRGWRAHRRMSVSTRRRSQVDDLDPREAAAAGPVRRRPRLQPAGPADLHGASCTTQGRRIVFDHHDLVPELFLSRFGRSGLLLPGDPPRRAARIPARGRRDQHERVVPRDRDRARPQATRGRVRRAKRTGHRAIPAGAAGPDASRREAHTCSPTSA